MKISEGVYVDVVVLSVKGNLTSEPDAKQLRGAVSDLLGQRVHKVVVDVGNVEQISSTGLG
jgi:anti-anti-sigma regulatory factor